jgi:uncharacterized protein YllA (UPF0747 family)
MKLHPSPNILRRSFALPTHIIEKARSLAPAELQNNLNRLVITALETYIAEQQHYFFSQCMERMAQDPEIQKINKEIEHDFCPAINDGL